MTRHFFKSARTLPERTPEEREQARFRTRVELSLERRKHIDEQTGCWLWTGFRMPAGHGQVSIFNTRYMVHRLSAMLHLGLVLEKRPVGSRKDRSQVNHKCQNAHCFNPEHLYIGTQRDNIHDIPAEKRGLGALPIMGHCRRGHPHDPATYRKGVGCRICRRESWRAFKQDPVNRAKSIAHKRAVRLAAREQRWLDEVAS